MKAPIVEIFSSFQGEGLLIGRRQIFIRFAGCNLNCIYCDTQISRNSNDFDFFSVDELIEKINNLITPDLHSISITGGEPTLYIDFINNLIEKIDYPVLLETNGSLPEEIAKFKKNNNNDLVSLDIKLPEFINNQKIYKCEIESIKILLNNNINVYSKVVVSPNTNLITFESIIKELFDEIKNIPISRFNLIIQPQSPMELWKNDINELDYFENLSDLSDLHDLNNVNNLDKRSNLNNNIDKGNNANKNKFFQFCEIAGKYFSVFLIPQVHKFLDIE
ncbi:MAG: 7-carboxy-7-deazaguanine synthase QueE [Methanobrevibacter sp.]|jgi:organic radical activating enzyme|nr:7-carboxy-7-deazaguanine synthase QueE [Candidatus Methanoflexus mossambicus]